MTDGCTPASTTGSHPRERDSPLAWGTSPARFTSSPGTVTSPSKMASAMMCPLTAVMFCTAFCRAVSCSVVATVRTDPKARATAASEMICAMMLAR